MNKRDYYEVLGVSRSASDSEIKLAHRRLRSRYHPDKYPDDSSAEKKRKEETFNKIQEAYNVLKDPVKRVNFDKNGHTEFDKTGAQPTQNVPMQDIIFHNTAGTFTIKIPRAMDPAEFFSLVLSGKLELLGTNDTSIKDAILNEMLRRLHPKSKFGSATGGDDSLEKSPIEKRTLPQFTL